MEFGFSRLEECVKVYTHSTEINCFLVDEEGKKLNKKGSICGFCHKAQKHADMNIDCAKVHRYGSYQSERYGGKYIFFCPMGLVLWASPVIENGMLKGAFLGGPVHMVEPDELLFEDLQRKVGNNQRLLEELWTEINKIPIVPPEKVSYLSELLFIVSTHVSQSKGLDAFEVRKSQAQQSYISEYIQSVKSLEDNDEKPKAYPLEKEEELLSLISKGNKSGSQKVLNEILGHIFFTIGGNFDVLKARVLELIVLLSRAALKGGADIELIFGMNYEYINQIHEFESVDELTYWLSKIMIRFTDCVFDMSNVKHVDVIYKAIDYIKRNYMNKITLEDVASEVHLSPSYFSKVFKEETNSNFNQYLNKIRIEHSKMFLSDYSLSLVDVSNLSGFEDQSYFSKVFKKITGLSPGKYRETFSKSS